MNTLKKTAAVVLAIAMVLTMGIATSFAAYPDVASTASYAEAVNILSNLGIFEGGDDGMFRPDNTITRAEVAAVMVRAKNLTETPGETVFTDVPANHWAAGYINEAYNADIIGGRGDGTFDPSGNVTFEEAVKMIVAALGYEPAAQQRGGWPTGYLALASEKKISNNTGGTVGQPATRATIAKLVYNALEVDMMGQTTYGTSAEFQPVEGQTLLTNLGVEKMDVVVTGSYYTDAAEDGEYDHRNHTVYLTSLKNNVTYDGEEYDKDNPFKDMAFEEGGTAAASLLGMACVAYIGVDDDTDDDTIFAISAKNARNTVTTVKSDLLADYDELNDSETAKADKGTVYYWRNGRTDRKPVALTPATDSNGDVDVRVFVNYDEQGDYDGSGDYFYEALVRNGEGGVAEFIDNNNDGDFDVVLVSQYSDEGVVETVRTTSDGLIDFRGMDGAKGVPEDYDPEDDSVLKLFVKGENYIEPTEIQAGDTITTIGVEGDDAIIVYLVSSDKIEGRSTSYDSETDTLTVAGKAYAASPMLKDELSQAKNTTGTFYLNADGLISLIDGSSAATGNWGYLIAVNHDQVFNREKYQVEILDGATGKVNDYNIKSERVAVYNDRNETTATRMTDDAAYDVLEDLINSDVDGENRLIKYTIENDELSKIVVGNSYGDIEVQRYTERTYDSDDRTIGSSNPIAENAFVFVVSDTDTDEGAYEDPDNISVVRGGRFVDGNDYDVIAFSENDIVVAAIVASDESEVDKTQGVFVVTGISASVTEDDEDVVHFTGFQNGATASFDLYDDVDGYAEDIANGNMELAKGSVLLVGPEENGYVDNIELLVEVLKSGNALDSIVSHPTEGTNNKKLYKSGMGQLRAFEDDGDYYYVDGSTIVVEDACPGYDEGENKGYKVHSNTNVTVVDLTASRISAASIRRGDVDFADVDPGKYEIWAFYRAYDVDDVNYFDLNDERSNVKDLVLFKLNDGDGSLVDADAAATQSYTHRDKVDDLDNGSYLDDDDDITYLDSVDDSDSLDEVDDDGMISLD